MGGTLSLRDAAGAAALREVIVVQANHRVFWPTCASGVNRLWRTTLLTYSVPWQPGNLRGRTMRVRTPVFVVLKT